jgi:hypothetical protein
MERLRLVPAEPSPPLQHSLEPSSVSPLRRQGRHEKAKSHEAADVGCRARHTPRAEDLPKGILVLIVPELSQLVGPWGSRGCSRSPCCDKHPQGQADRLRGPCVPAKKVGLPRSTDLSILQWDRTADEHTRAGGVDVESIREVGIAVFRGRWRRRRTNRRGQLEKGTHDRTSLRINRNDLLGARQWWFVLNRGLHANAQWLSLRASAKETAPGKPLRMEGNLNG